MTSHTEPSTIVEISTTKATLRVGSETKAWIELRIPERTRKSPTIASVPASRMSEAFHTFSIPRFSWIMIEWMYAVQTRNGISAAFSTGSHSQ